MCGRRLPSTRARYCSRACRQHGYRLRHRTSTAELQVVRQELRDRRALVVHTVYECPSCGERFVGERRCPECGLFCRRLGLGASCPECDQPILLADLLGKEVLPTA
jgi:ribosomal protein L32